MQFGKVDTLAGVWTFGDLLGSQHLNFRSKSSRWHLSLFLIRSYLLTTKKRYALLFLAFHTMDWGNPGRQMDRLGWIVSLSQQLFEVSPGAQAQAHLLVDMDDVRSTICAPVVLPSSWRLVDSFPHAGTSAQPEYRDCQSFELHHGRVANTKRNEVNQVR